MRIKVFLAPLVLALLFSVPPNLSGAQAGSAPGASQAPRQANPILQTAAGELAKVDPGSMSLWIKAADGKEMQFKYTDSTQVTGAADSPAGLASKGGSRVSVTFQKVGDANITSKIEVLPRS